MVETVNTLPKHARKTMDHSQMNYLHAFSNYLANTREKGKGYLQYSINSRKIIAAPIFLTSMMHKFHKVLILIAAFIIFTS